MSYCCIPKRPKKTLFSIQSKNKITYWGINEGDTSKDTAGKLTTLKATQERHTETLETTKGQVWVNG